MSQEPVGEEFFYVNGVNASTGEYLEGEPWTPDDVWQVLVSEKTDRAEAELLWEKHKREQPAEQDMMATFGVMMDDLTQAGWAVVFAQGADPRVKEALAPLLEHRKETTAGLYKEYDGETAYIPGQSWQDFRLFHEIDEGLADPQQMPYYVLLVGDPETIPYAFQYQLDVERAVGRIHFDTPEEYERYARSVVEAEETNLRLPRRATFWGPANRDDEATRRSAEFLVKPLVDDLVEYLADTTWAIDSVPPKSSMKERLGQLMGGADTPALLFTASHGVGFNRDDERQSVHQGALLCQDWPGRLAWRKRLPEDFYFHAGDLGPDARVWGMIALLFACYGAGTPRLNDFVHRRDQGLQERMDVSDRAFVAPLAQRLLSHPNGGALAVVGHVDRAWDTSFLRPGEPSQEKRDLGAFRNLLRPLVNNWPLGYALEGINKRHAGLGTSLAQEMHQIRFQNLAPDKVKLARLWTANNDARNYVIVGDPAVKLVVAQEDEEAAAEHPVLGFVPTERPYELQPGAGRVGERVPRVEEAPAPKDAELEIIEADFGIKDLFRGKEDEPSALRQFVDKVAQSLHDAISEAVTLRVVTYVSDDMGAVDYDRDTKTFSGAARLRAMTVIELDGDVIACVPSKDGKVDEALWTLHLEMVEKAQTSRNELFKTAVSAVTSLVRAGGGS
jgi:hypothetical protein